MKATRQILSWVLAISLVISCGIVGLVLPTSAEAPVDLLNGQGSFEEGTTPESTILSDAMAQADAVIVDNPDGEGKVLQLGKFVDEDADGVNDVAYTHGSYPKWKKLYNAETGKYDKYLKAGKCYTLSFDVYGDAIGFYTQTNFRVQSHNAEDWVSNEAGWFELGGVDGWKTYTFVFVPDADIATAYHSDWWSWATNFVKSTKNSYTGTAGFTYIDNMTVVETQATAIELDVEKVVLEPGDKTEAPVVTVTPKNSAYADVVYSVDKAEVATVDAATGVITAVANGTATVTATAGELTDTIQVVVQKDKTQAWADMSTATYATGDNKGQNVTLNTDAATGLQYFSVSSSAQVKVPNFTTVAGKNVWVGLTFLVRVTDGANNAGSVRGAVQMQNIVEGYIQPEFYARTAAMKGDWERVTFYAKTNNVTNTPWCQFITLTGGDAATYSYDVADVSYFLPDADEVNLFGYGTDFEGGYAPHAVGNPSQSGLLTKADAEIVDDPTGADNKVFYISQAGANSGSGDYWYAAWRGYHDETGTRKAAVIFEVGKMYKVSFRVYSASDVVIDSYGGCTFKGTTGTGKKSGQWRTVTTYMTAGSSLNSSYALHVRFYGEAYIDDLEMYEVGDATDFEIKGATEMTIGESQTLEIVPVPKHAFPGTLTTTLADGTTGLTLSGTTVTAAAVTGVEVKGGTVTVTSSLTDADGQPITSSMAIKVNYPEEHFVNGTMDTGDLTGLTFTGAGTHAVDGNYAFGVDGVGLNGTKGAALYSTGAKYFKGQSTANGAPFILKPNTVYVFSAYARANGTGAKLELNLVTGNNASGNKLVTVSQVGYDGARAYVDTQWTYYAMYVKTGDTTTYMDTNWNLYFNVRGLPTGVPDGEKPAIFLDNVSFRKVDEGDNILTGEAEAHDFEDGEHEYFMPRGNALTSDLLAEGEGRNGSTALKIPNDKKATTYSIRTTPFLDEYGLYKISFWTKADQQFIDEGGKMGLYWGTANAGKVYSVSSTNDANFYATTEWKLNEFVFVTNGGNSLAGGVFYFNTATTTVGTGNIYFDDLKIECLANDNFLTASTSNTSQSFSIDGGNTWKSYVTNVEPGTVVKVKNWQYSGYVMTPGSLKYTTPDGTAVKILNKDITNGYTKDNFGDGDGRIFEFKMPATSARVSVTFTKDANNTFRLDTVGTSLRYTGNDTYDGIRFLTRLNMGVSAIKKVDDTITLNVKYNGENYEIVELGSYLKRYSETTTGEGEEAVTTEDKLTAENKVWTSVAYKKGETDMVILDYTEQYIDFTTVMRKGESVAQDVFEARKYTARGYVVLQNAEGNQITVLANGQQSDSVDSVQERMQ